MSDKKKKETVAERDARIQTTLDRIGEKVGDDPEAIELLQAMIRAYGTEMTMHDISRRSGYCG